MVACRKLLDGSQVEDALKEKGLERRQIRARPYQRTVRHYRPLSYGVEVCAL